MPDAGNIEGGRRGSSSRYADHCSTVGFGHDDKILEDEKLDVGRGLLRKASQGREKAVILENVKGAGNSRLRGEYAPGDLR